ncbi:MAG: dipeptide epimerase [Verrucomicrobiota bacterium]
MNINFWLFDLKLARTWAVSSNAASGGQDVFTIVLVELEDDQGRRGVGEAAPSSRYNESAKTVKAFLKRVDPNRLSFANVVASMDYLESVAPGNYAAKTAINLALLDAAGRHAGEPIYELLNLGFTENQHVTSFSVGIDRPEIIRQKVLEADGYPVLKLKVGSPNDRENLAALREVAPKKPVRVDANEGWTTKEEALRSLEWLAADGNIQFVEQPMPVSTPARELSWLRKRSPLPLFADESYHHAKDVALCSECFHGVNVKLVKAGGITGAHEALLAARKAGLKTMIGCMIESSVLISAAAHLAELADYLDLDGNLLITNDPYAGVTADRGVLAFASALETTGLRVRARQAE